MILHNDTKHSKKLSIPATTKGEKIAWWALTAMIVYLVIAQ